MPAQSLETALYVFAEQAHVALSLPDGGVAGARSNQLRGRFPIEGGLHQLLAGSGYGFERAGDNAYRIVAVNTPNAQHADNSDETIIVIGRRPTPLSELPRAVTRVGSETLAASGGNDVGALNAYISGFSLSNLGAGRDKLILRGISDGALSGRAQSTVGIYLDGVRLTYAAPDPDLQLVDVAHVDVLRGPQGAQFGAGSIGGIVYIESNPVDLLRWTGETLAGAEATQGGQPSNELQIIANAPLVQGRFGLRAVAYRQDTGGWLDNSVTGQTDTNETVRTGARLQALLSFSNWSVTAFGAYQSIDSADSQYLVGGASDPARMANLLEPHDNDFRTLGVTLRASTAWGDLTSTSARVRHDIDSRYDATGAFAPLGVNLSMPRPFDEDDRLSIFLNETRLTSGAGARTPWLLGVFYADGDYSRDYELRDGVSGVWQSLAYRERRSDAIDEVAAFGEVSWPLAERLTLVTGIRVSQFLVVTHSSVDEAILGLSDAFSGSTRKIDYAPDIRLAYRPYEHVLFYASAARGYRGGGFNTGGPVGASFTSTQPTRVFSGDDLWAFELGARFAAFEGRLNVDATLFHNIWSNIQTDSLIANGFTYTGNVGDGRATGFEASATFRVSDDLNVGAVLLYNETELRDRDTAFPSATPGSFPGAPDWSFGASARYERPLVFAQSNARMYAEGSAAYTGETRSGFGVSPQVGGYASFNVRLGLAAGPWDVSLYGLNLGNSEGATLSNGNPYLGSGATLVTPPRPQTVGLSLRRTF